MPLLSDPVTLAGLVTREIRSGVRDGVPTKVAVARRSYSTDQADLWEALTDPERIPRWFLPISGELALGGRYQLAGNAGGVVEECDEPKGFAVTWEMGPQVSWVRVVLTPSEAGTLLELAHEAPVDPGFWTQYGPGAVGVGWDLALVGLGLYLTSGAPVDQAEALTLHTTPEGKEFIRTAAAGWAEAAIGDGDEPDAARAAAANTVTFYTTESEESPES
ncbi:SRPBCC family protein [Nocardia brasiliensis]|uniref:SRPBCC family protein n=1 Tax=Nocardia brasiliensis TaxID=37326 RepID=UPI003D936AC4